MHLAGKKIVIIGATSAIAEHCARRWAAECPAHIVLVGRDGPRTEAVARDLRIRATATAIQVIATDFHNPDMIQAVIDGVHRDGPIDLALIAHGSLPDQVECQDSLGNCERALAINGISPVLFAEVFARHMQQAGRGTLAIIGSVAGDRGRKSNYVYGAAKGLVTRYAQGLQHRFAGSDVHVVLIKPGPTDTPMTAHLKQRGARLASAEQVAACIVRGVARRRRVVYAPAKWRVVMQVVRHLPNVIFDRLDL